jgi:hypothetical protein
MKRSEMYENIHASENKQKIMEYVEVEEEESEKKGEKKDQKKPLRESN